MEPSAPEPSTFSLQGLTSLSDNELVALLNFWKVKLSGADFPMFAREVLKLKTPRHYQEWWTLANQTKRLLVQAHRDSWKSFFWSRAYPLYRAVTEPGVNICLISYSEQQARKNLYWIKQMLETLPQLQQFVPKNNTFTWQKTFLHLTNGSTIEAKGFGSAMRGGHFHYIIGDDLLKDGSSMPHEDQENFFFGVITPACRKTGQIIVIGTPLEYGDLLEKLEKNPVYTFKRYPAIVVVDGEPKVWFDEEYTMADVDRWKRESPNYWFFAREYLLQRINPDKASFRESWIRYYSPRDLNDEKTHEQTPLFKVLTIDPALSEKGDYNGIIVTGTDKHNTTYVLESVMLRGDLSTIINRIFDLYERHHPDIVGAEMYGFQKFLKFWLEEEMAKRNQFFSVIQLEAGQKKSKNMRILGLQPKIELGKVMFRKDADMELVNQLLSFDYSRKDNSDDGIDSLAYQVSLWRPPDPDKKGGAPQGSFDDVVATSDKAAAPQAGYITQLFSDVLPPDDKLESNFVAF